VDRALIRETETLQQLNHPFIVSYLGLQESDESQEVKLYLEYCEGGDLQTMHVQVPSTKSKENPDADSGDYYGPTSRAARFKKISQPDGPAVASLSEPEIWELVYQLFAALACLHYGVSLSRDWVCRIEPHWNPVVHRDVKPQNGKSWS
jgi:serine/threonine protein kinase